MDSVDKVIREWSVSAPLVVAPLSGDNNTSLGVYQAYPLRDDLNREFERLVAQYDASKLGSAEPPANLSEQLFRLSFLNLGFARCFGLTFVARNTLQTVHRALNARAATGLLTDEEKSAYAEVAFVLAMYEEVAVQTQREFESLTKGGSNE